MTSLNDSIDCSFHLNRTPAQSIFLTLKALYVLPSAIFLKFLFIALICGHNRKSYTSVFYRLLILGICATICTHIPHTVIELIAKKPASFCSMFASLSVPSIGLSIYRFFIEAFELIHLSTATAIAVYRCHSVLHPQTSQAWKRRKWPIFSFVFYFPFLLVAPILFTKAYAVILNDELYFMSQPLAWYSSEYLHLIICIICSIIVISCQIAIMFSDKSAWKPSKQQDAGLFNVGLAETFLIVIYTIVQFLIFFNEHRSAHSIRVDRLIYYIGLLASDAFGFLPPWILFFSNPNVKRDALPFKRILKKTGIYNRCCKEENESEAKV